MGTLERQTVILFAEDVRDEVNGMVSVIGLHTNQVGIQAYPTKIERLSVLVDARFPADALPAQLGFKLTLNGEEVLAEASAPLESPSQTFKDVADHRINVRLHFKVKSFEVSKKTELKMAIFADGEEVGVNHLFFIRTPTKTGTLSRRELPMASPEKKAKSSKTKK